ncbi:MAG: TonB-dependent receptor [Rhodothermales bacterium]|nr:TonB-dependent receptor [Rhodothermales bacterium]
MFSTLKRAALIFLFGVVAISQQTSAQSALVGHVVDASSGEGVVMASVIIVNTQVGVATDRDGHFSLILPDGKSVLRVSAIGYDSKLVEVDDPSKHLHITLQPSIIQFDEVVVSTVGPRVNDPAASPHNMRGVEDLMDRIPGADFLQRANFAWEPVVRGMSGGQVGLVIDGMKVTGACVDRMDPTSAYVEVENLEKLELTKGGFDLTKASQIGGTINLTTQKPRFDRPFYGDAEFGFESAASLRRGRLVAGAAKGNTSVRGSYSYKMANDFRVGGPGEITNSGYRKNNYKLDLSQRIGSSHEVAASFLGDNAWDVGYPVLLMDATLAQARIYSLTHSWIPKSSAAVQSLETRAYYNTVDHYMDDFERDVLDRPVMRGMNMPMYGYTRTAGSISTLDLGLGTRQLRLTLDAYQTKSFGDMWMFSVFENIPDMYLLNLGDVVVQHGALSADFASPVTSRLNARVNARVDLSPRDVKKEEAIAILEGKWETTDLSNRYLLGSASASFEFALSKTTRTRLSLAHVGRLPTHVENYGHYIYNYVDGYFYSGNPRIKPERSSQVELGLERWTQRFGIRAAAYTNYVRNYIYGVNDEGLVNTSETLRFRVFTNADAAVLAGGELSAVVRLAEGLEVAGTTSYTYGQNLDAGEPMYLIPPLTSLLSVRLDRGRWWGEAEARMALPQNRVARITADELGTDGYLVANLRGSFKPRTGVEVKVGVENLFDTLYHEHLSFGDLPSLGRNIYGALALSL